MAAGARRSGLNPERARSAGVGGARRGGNDSGGGGACQARPCRPSEDDRADVGRRLDDLARDDPHLAGLALGDLGQGLQVLVGEQLGVGVTLVDSGEDLFDGLELACARRISASRAPSARAGSRTASRPRRSGSATASPSAVRIAARRSRSARICFSMASWIVTGGSMALSSTRLTRMPQRPVASSSATRSAVLMSRDVVCPPRSSPPRCAAW